MAFSAEQTKEQQRLANLLDIHSNYYRIQGEIRLDRARVLLTSVLFSEPGKPVRVIMRQFDKVNEQQNSNNHVSATSPNS
jgi:general secretion pathway protein K